MQLVLRPYILDAEWSPGIVHLSITNLEVISMSVARQVGHLDPFPDDDELYNTISLQH